MRLATLIAVIVMSTSSPVSAAGFELSFDWGDIPLCTSGTPNIVPNPEFRLAGVPDGTATIRFRMVDLDVPSYPHGGGDVPWAGEPMIAPGAFEYRSPCPPSGRHTYEWTATALSADGNPLATAKAARVYP